MRLVTKSDFDFSKAAVYRKVVSLAKEHVRRAEKQEHIVTLHSSGIETENTARVGDYIIGVPGEGDGYIISSDLFLQTYEQHPDKPDAYHNIKTRKMLMTLQDMRFIAAWGAEMNVLAGGMIAEEGDHIYAVDRFSFIRNFGRVDSTDQHNTFCLLTESLDTQLQKAQALNELHHIHDIVLRLENPHLFIKRDA